MFANFFLDKTNAELNKDVTGFDDEVLNMFINYPWPGNLREFRNVIRRCVLLTNTGNISASTLPPEITGSINITASQEAQNDMRPVNMDLKDSASRAEYEMIMQVLKEVNFNKTRAAELLKIDRKTLYNKIKSYEDIQN